MQDAGQLMPGGRIKIRRCKGSLSKRAKEPLALRVVLLLYLLYMEDLENSESKKVWFKRKLYGWGWYPVSTEGWLSLLVYVGFIGFIFAYVKLDTSSIQIIFTLTLPVFLASALFLALCFYKGEKPMWRWGNKKFSKERKIEAKAGLEDNS